MKFDELDINKWEDFESKSIDLTPFDKFSWKKIWVNSFDENYNYQLAYNHNFFIPIKILNDHATFIGDKDVVDYNNLLSKENNIDDFLDLLNKIFQTKISKLSLYSISEDSHFFSNFKNSKLENLYKVNIQEEDVSPYLLLPETWDEYLMNLSKKRRHEIKRKIRRFEENFDFSSGDHNSIDNFEEIFDDFIRLHKLSSDEKKLFMNSDREKFFKELIYKFLSENNLLYSYLKVENQTVACSISFSQNNIRYLYNSGFDPKYIKHSTGLINHLFAIKRSIENKYEIFDFMRGNERYKYDLGGIDKKVYSVLLERK